MRAAWLLASASLVAASGAIDLSGAWLHASGDLYTIKSTSNPLNFSVTCTTGSCATWSVATIGITDPDTGSVLIDFTGQHRNHTGRVSLPTVLTLTWSDASTWTRDAPPPGVTVDVVIIPHSHDDAGWQRTFEGYYEVETVKIINNIVTWLTNTPNGRFIQVETSFLQRWWVDQNATMRDRFTALVQSRRLELVGGGWTMHDEESTSVYSAVSNMEYGLTWLDRTFGTAYRPRVLWQIDPSGHALVTPTVAAQLGYDAIIIDRIPDPVRQAFRKNLSLQFVWTPGQGAPSTFATVLDSFYCNPHISGDTPGDRASSFFADVLRRVNSYRPDASGHMTILWPWGCDFAFQSMSDFDSMTGVVEFMGANPALFQGVTARFGTLSEYFDTLHAQDIAFPTQGKRDFHPYVWCWEPEDTALCYNLPSTPDPAYWRTGMYTSKVALKGNSRVLDASLHAADGMYALVQVAARAAAAARQGSEGAGGCSGGRLLRGAQGLQCGVPQPACGVPPPPQSLLDDLSNGRATSGLMTHHDAITGTAYVSCSLGPPYTQCNCYEDYMQQMANSTIRTEGVLAASKNVLLALPGAAPGALLFGNATAATASGLTPSSLLILAVGNPTGWARREIMRLHLLSPIPAGYNASVSDTHAPPAPVVSQVVWDHLRNAETLYFVADVPALSTVTYAVSLVAAPAAGPAAARTAASVGAPLTLSNGKISIAFDATGRIASWGNATSGVSIPLSHQFLVYDEHLPGGNLIGGTVYGFEPINGSAPRLVGPDPNGTGAIPLFSVAAGPLVWEAAQEVAPWVIHSVRLFAPLPAPSGGYADALPWGEVLEFQTRMGPLPFALNTGGSVVSSFAPGAGCRSHGATSPGATLTTDTSGFQTLVRPPFDPMQYAQGQVYPTYPGWDFAFSACDGTGSAAAPSVLSHVAERPMGTAVQSNSSVWQMLHRRLNNPSDDRGNETTVIDEPIVVALADATSGWSSDASRYLLPRQVTARLVAQPLTLHAAPFPSLAAYQAVGQAAYSPPWIGSSLPPGVHLHSLLSRDGSYPAAPGASGGGNQSTGAKLGLRLQQLPYASPSTVDLAAWVTLAGTFTETTSDFNEARATAEAKRLVWRTLGEDGSGAQSAGSTRRAASRSEGAAEHAEALPVSFDVEAVRSFQLQM